MWETRLHPHILPFFSEHTHEIASTISTQSNIPKVNMNGNFNRSISGRITNTSGTCSAPNSATVIQNLASFQKSRNPMTGIIIAAPAANGAEFQLRAPPKKPRSKGSTSRGPLIDQTLIFLQDFTGPLGLCGSCVWLIGLIKELRANLFQGRLQRIHDQMTCMRGLVWQAADGS